MRARSGLAGLFFLVGCGAPDETTSPEVPPRYVGAPACAECHGIAVEAWRGSHHDLAMQVANETTVLGDFDDATLTHFGVTSTFLRRGEAFVVRTEGPDGEPAEYEIEYTFGVAPLQQYLVKFPGGRYQTLPLCWDTRPVEDGGQRWFHIYPDEAIRPGDVLHWTRPSQNWNHMCADCHSTNLRKGYSEKDDRLETTFSEIDVSCEACHGPGSRHVAWANERTADAPAVSATDDLGLAVRLRDLDGGAWSYEPGSPTAKRTVARASHAELESCARCHARRSNAHGAWNPGDPLLDGYRVALLDESLYHPDGQVEEEVYVYGSFLQSKMYAEGVTCTDCHDPHRGDVYSDGNALCAKCHSPAVFDTPAHHFHEAGSTGALCVECHMPERTYMVVDPRRDHSLRVPRPDLSVKMGTPNACNACHTDRSARWAADAVERWYGEDRRAEPHWGEAIEAGRTAQAGAAEALVKVARDPAVPGIARATAVSLLPRYLGPGELPALVEALTDDDPLVRSAAVDATQVLDPMMRLRILTPRLSDPVRMVRHAAARALAPVPPALLSADQRAELDAVIGEYVAWQRENGDRPEARLRLGALHLARGDLAEAEREFRRAIEIEPAFAPAWVNLADLMREKGDDRESERVLRSGIEHAPDDADLRHALGLALVRLDRHGDALEELASAVALAPDRARLRYVYAVALLSTGDEEGARREIRDAVERHPGDPEIQALRVQLGL